MLEFERRTTRFVVMPRALDDSMHDCLIVSVRLPLGRCRALASAALTGDLAWPACGPVDRGSGEIPRAAQGC